jgi:hypothetical protein
MGGRWESRSCETSRVSQLETDIAEWNSLEAECIGGQGLTGGCSAVGGRE